MMLILLMPLDVVPDFDFFSLFSFSEGWKVCLIKDPCI